MANPYTPRQGQYLAFIHAYGKMYGRPPSEAEIATHFMVSPPSAHQMVVTLEQRGLIQRTPGVARSIHILLPSADIPDLDGRRPQQQERRSSDDIYPYIARWLVNGGSLELGTTGPSGSMARALLNGRIVWEGKSSYSGLDELLIDLNTGIAGRASLHVVSSRIGGDR